MEAKDVSIPTRVVCPTQRLGQRTTHKGHRAGGCKKSSSAGGERACPASLHLHKQRAQCATVLDLSTVVVRAVRRGSRRGSQRKRLEHARRLDQQRRRDAAPLLITPHRCRHRVFASNSSLPSSCGRSSTMKSSLHACAADCTDTRHRHSSAQANGGAPAAGWHPLRTYLSRMDAKGQVVAKTHDDIGSPARSPAGATAPPCPCLCKGETPMKTRTSTLM